MRTEEIKMERPGQAEIGKEYEVIEKSTEAFYYYILMPAIAMSGNYSLGERIKSGKGIVRDIREDARGYFVYVEFDE